MSKLRFRTALGILLCLGWFCLAPAPASPAQAPEATRAADTADAAEAADAAENGDGTFIDRVDVNVVNVEVFVTDKKGRAITGLTKEDFELTVDGQNLPVSNLYAQEDNRPVYRAAPEATAEEPAATAPAPQEVPQEQRLRLVVFVDQTALQPLNRKRSFKHIRRFLEESLAPEAEVAVISLAPGLRFHTDFTTDREVVQKILKELEKSPPLDLGTEAERRTVLQEIFNAPTSSPGGSAFDQMAASGAAGNTLALIRAIAATEYSIHKTGTRAMKAMVDTLAGVPGRKAMLHVSDGVPTNPGEDLFIAWQNRFSQLDTNYQTAVGSYDLIRDFQDFADHANASKVTFYAVDADPPTNTFGKSAEFQGDPNELPSVTSEVLSTFEANKRATIELAALETGGKRVIANGMLPRQLKRLGNDFRSFYSLGFAAPAGKVKDHHQVKVRVKGRKGLVVRHRSGFADRDADQKAAGQTMAALLYGVGEDPLGVTVTPGERESLEDGTATLPLALELPFDRLALLPDGEERVATLSLFVTVQDQVGAARPVQHIAVRLKVPEEEMESSQGQSARYVLPVIVGTDDRRIALAIRDDIAGIVSTLRVDLETPARASHNGKG